MTTGIDPSLMRPRFSEDDGNTPIGGAFRKPSLGNSSHYLGPDAQPAIEHINISGFISEQTEQPNFIQESLTHTDLTSESVDNEA